MKLQKTSSPVFASGWKANMDIYMGNGILKNTAYTCLRCQHVCEPPYNSNGLFSSLAHQKTRTATCALELLQNQATNLLK